MTISNIFPSDERTIGPRGKACRTVESRGGPAWPIAILIILAFALAAVIAPKAAAAMPPIPEHVKVSITF